jgi:hypothetical protein
MRVIPVDLIRLDDATWWVRAGSRMMQIEESEWLTTAVDVAPVEVLKAEVPNAASPTVREKAPRKVKAPKAVKAPRAPAPAKVAAKLRREAGLPPKKKRVKPDEAKVARAKKLVEHQSVKRGTSRSAEPQRYLRRCPPRSHRARPSAVRTAGAARRPRRAGIVSNAFRSSVNDRPEPVSRRDRAADQ